MIWWPSPSSGTKRPTVNRPMRKALTAIACLILAGLPLGVAAEEPPIQPNENGNFLPDPTQQTPLGEQKLGAVFSANSSPLSKSGLND